LLKKSKQMKKIILNFSLVFFALCLAFSAKAQVNNPNGAGPFTTPRWGPGMNWSLGPTNEFNTGNNTGSALNWSLNPTHITTTGGTDSLRAITYTYNTLYYDTVTAALKLICDTTKKKNPFAKAYLGDRLEFLFTNTTGSGVAVTPGYGFVLLASSPTITVGSGKNADIIFIFDGAFWREVSRSVE
jgi:hypothetical protein